jgi:hypothetical protein
MGAGLARAGQRFGRDERGGILVLSAVALALLFGMMALVWDLGRAMSTATELQSFADHMALAAAAELDGRPDARIRALAAIDGLLTERQSFAAGGAQLSGADVATPVAFYRSLPADDGAPLTDLAASDAEAAFVEIVLRPRTVTNLFAGLAGAMTGTALADPLIGARALAGRSRVACDITPLMFCAPGGADYQPQPGRMLHLRTDGQWRPGELGLLEGAFDPDSACGGAGPEPTADFVRCALGLSARITQCFSEQAVTIASARQPGGLAAGLNTRFDIYQANLAAQASNPQFAPAPNVVKGLAPAGGGACIADVATARDLSVLPLGIGSVPLPRDACFDALGLCIDTGGPAGTGITALALDAYWLINHGTLRPPATTRFALYQAELADPPAADRILEAPRLETGMPACFGGGATPTPQGAERRILTAAAVDCGEPGFPFAGPVENVPVLAFVELFLTEPATVEGAGDITAAWVEELGEVAPDLPGSGAAQVHDVVQLHR